MLLRALLLFLAALVVRQWAVHPGLESDTLALADGARALLQCGMDSPCAEAQHFPLFQYLPSFLMAALGFAPKTIVKVLAGFSVIAGAAILEIFSRLARPQRELGLLLMVTSPLLVYSASSFGEMVAALWILLLTRAALKSTTPLGTASPERFSLASQVFVFALLAGITKEIAWPFLLLTGGLAMRRSIRGREWRKVLPLAAGLVASTGLNAGFNLWRFGSVRNLALLQDHYQVKDWATHASFTAGLWFSPNGGILVFWPAFAVLLALVLKDRATRIRGLAIAGFLALLTLGLGRWFAPMGWIAWGPRLLLPWIPAWSYLLLSRPVAWPRSRNFWIPVAGVCVAIGLAHFMSLLSFTPKDLLFSGSPECPLPVAIEKSARAYYACIRNLTWPTRTFAIAYAWMEIFRRPLHAVAAAAYLGALWLYGSRVRIER